MYYELIFLVLVESVTAFNKDILISVAVSVASTLLFCLILSLFVWRFCIRDGDPSKHQFDPNIIVNPYSYQSTNTDVCAYCGSKAAQTVSGNDHTTEANESSAHKPEEVVVMVHSNTSDTGPTSDSNAEQTTNLLQQDSVSFMVHLIKTESGALGLSIVGGRSSRLGDIGIFIKSIIQDSPASMNGQLKPWDQILVVNDRSFDGITIHEALSVLKSIPSEVYLTILPSEVATAKLEASLRKTGKMLETNDDLDQKNLQCETVEIDNTNKKKKQWNRHSLERSDVQISYAETERYIPDEDEDVFEDLSGLESSHNCEIGETIMEDFNSQEIRDNNEVIDVMVHDAMTVNEYVKKENIRNSPCLRDFTIECDEEDVFLPNNNTPPECVDMSVEEIVTEKADQIITFEDSKYSSDQIRITFNSDTAIVCNGNT